MQSQITLTAIVASFAASAATLMLALAPALSPVTAPRTAAGALRVVELPRVVIAATREPRVVELPRVVIEARRATAPTKVLAGAATRLQPVMSLAPN